MRFSKNDEKLLKEVGIYVEDKDYTKNEVEHIKMKITDYIMSQSSKDINKYNMKFSNILYN